MAVIVWPISPSNPACCPPSIGSDPIPATTAFTPQSVPETLKFCIIKSFMPENYRLDPTDLITAWLWAVGNSDNDLGGEPCVCNC